MEWIADPSVGDWLHERLDETLTKSMHGVVPRGYAAYARVFHPAQVRSLPGGRVPTDAEWDRMPPTEQTRVMELLVDEPATWADAAAAFGTTLHPLAQWHRLVGAVHGEDWHAHHSHDGREFHSPRVGTLEPDLLAAVARHLADHTTTADAGVAALWDGWGDLVGHLGHAPTQPFVGGGGDDERHQQMLSRSIHDPLNNAFRKPTWQEGTLSREISEGPRLRLHDRAYVLFATSARDVADPRWAGRAPWRDKSPEQWGLPAESYSPTILWPTDRAWVLVSDIDVDSTVIGGSRELIAALCADDRLEALPIPAGSSLAWDADEVNT